MTDPSDNEKGKQLTSAELAIIEMLKKQNISAQAVPLQQGDSIQQHAFWDSQVIMRFVLSVSGFHFNYTNTDRFNPFPP